MGYSSKIAAAFSKEAFDELSDECSENIKMFLNNATKTEKGPEGEMLFIWDWDKAWMNPDNPNNPGFKELQDFVGCNWRDVDCQMTILGEDVTQGADIIGDYDSVWDLSVDEDIACCDDDGDEVSSLRDELAKTKTELAETKKELAEAKKELKQAKKPGVKP